MTTLVGRGGIGGKIEGFIIYIVFYFGEFLDVASHTPAVTLHSVRWKFSPGCETVLDD
jgi:hypothetical protein